MAHLYRQDEVGLYSAQASFFLLSSMIPFLTLLVLIARFLIPIPQETLISYVVSYVPEPFDPILSPILTELYEKRTVSLLSVSAVTVLWSAGKGTLGLRRGVRRIFHLPYGGGFFRHILFRIADTFYLLISVFLMLVLLVTTTFLGNYLANLSPFFGFLIRFRVLLFFLILWAFFLSLYVLFCFEKSPPSGGSRRKRFFSGAILPHLPGAAFAAAGWIALSLAFALYLRYFPNASYVWGSFAAFGFLSLYLYFCVRIFLIGAQINRYLSGNIYNKR